MFNKQTDVHMNDNLKSNSKHLKR